jgi:hypothetical protein
LNDKITKGDDNIWHWKNTLTWTKDVVNILLYGADNRILRGDNSIIKKYNAVNSYNSTYTIDKIFSLAFDNSTNKSTTEGFRPVLNYIEADIANEVK